MDPTRFDRLARHAARRPSRRAMLAALGGGLLATLGGGGAGAQSRRVEPCGCDHECGAGRECVRGECVARSCRTCGEQLDYFRERFQQCYGDVKFCGGRPYMTCCGFCASWAGCRGPFETGTECGTVYIPSCRGLGCERNDDCEADFGLPNLVCCHPGICMEDAC